MATKPKLTRRQAEQAEDDRLAKLSPGARAEFLISRFGVFESVANSEFAQARLGQFEVLTELLESEDKIDAAMQALAEVTPKTYRHIDRALDSRSPSVKKAAVDALRPGRGRFFAADAADFPLVKAGAASKHAAVRMDAANLLVDRAFPSKTRREAVALLAELARDGSSEVRRLTALSLGRVGERVAAEAREALAPLLRDEHEKVRKTAQCSAAAL